MVNGQDKSSITRQYLNNQRRQNNQNKTIAKPKEDKIRQ